MMTCEIIIIACINKQCSYKDKQGIYSTPHHSFCNLLMFIKITEYNTSAESQSVLHVLNKEVNRTLVH